MSEVKQPTAVGKGKAFFDRADQVASTANYDFAIEMYLEGIVREPGNVERGHKPLRDVAMKRKQKGGKGPGMMETLKYRPGKDPVQSLRNAEFLLSKDPGSVAYMEQVLNASITLQLSEVTKWISDLMVTVQKLDKRTLLHLCRAFESIQEYKAAVTACRRALELTPADETLKDMLRGLESNATIKAGGYDQDGSFTKGVKDMGAQKDLIEKDKFMQGREYLEAQIARTRKDYEGTPTVMGKINAFVDALLKIEEETFEEEAVAVLNKALLDTKAYQFKMRIGDVRIRQKKRRYNKLMAEGNRQAAVEEARKQLEFELAEYAERAVNYPTDLAIRYELGRRHFIAGHLDEAISSFQQSQRDPRRHITSVLMLGQSFTRKGWLTEARETYEKILDLEMTEDRRKEVLYNLADVLEKTGLDKDDPELFKKSMEHFSRLAQMDYNYKDVRKRLEALRNRLYGASGSNPAPATNGPTA